MSEPPPRDRPNPLHRARAEKAPAAPRSAEDLKRSLLVVADQKLSDLKERWRPQPVAAAAPQPDNSTDAPPTAADATLPPPPLAVPPPPVANGMEVDIEQFLLLAEQHLERLEPTTALERLKAVGQLGTLIARYWKLHALALEQLDREQEALYSLAVALKLDPLDREAWLKKAAILKYLGRHAEAFEAKEMAERLGG